MNATIVEIAMEPHPTSPLNISLRSLPPISQLITAPASGAKMIRLRRLFSIIKLVLHHTRIIHIDRLAVAEERDDNAEADGGFRGGDGHYHEYKKLSRHIAVVTRKRDKCQVDGVEHQLDAHEHPDRVALKNNAD